MNMSPADPISLTLFVLFSIGMFFGVIWTFKKAEVGERYAFIYGGFVVLVSLLTLSGLMRSYVIPLVPLVMVSMIGMAFYFARSPLGKSLANHRSYSFLIGFQVFRLPLELILHRWAVTRVIPETMTWSGQNWDIVTGILALLLFPFANRSKWVPWLFEIVGTLLLINVIRVVMFSLPLPFAWNLEVPLQLPFEFPYVLIAPLFVWPAIFGHCILWRKLMR